MEKNIYESKSVCALIFTFSLPSILSLIIEIMTSVVDTMFAGHLGKISTSALTAMGLLSPILSIYIAFQALFALSTSILIARHLNNSAQRDGYFVTGIVFTLIVSILVSLLSFISMDWLLQLLGAKQEIFFLAKQYLEIQLVSNVFSALGYTLTSSIRAFGYPKIEMLFTTCSVIVNIIANFLFTFGLHMGFKGLAMGTFVSEVCCSLLSILWLVKKGLLPHSFNLKNMHLFSKTKELFHLGLAQTIIQTLGSCSGFFVNHSLMIYATVNHVAIWSIVQKIYTLMLMPIVGITQGVQTIIAYYSGHGQEKNKHKTISLTMIYTVLYGIVAMFIVFVLNSKVLGIFSTSNIILLESSTILKIVFLTFPVVGIFYTILTLLEVTGYEIRAVALTLLRQVFLILPLIYILPNLFPKSNNIIFWAMPIADVCVLAVSFIFNRPNKSMKKEIKL